MITAGPDSSDYRLLDISFWPTGSNRSRRIGIVVLMIVELTESWI